MLSCPTASTDRHRRYCGDGTVIFQMARSLGIAGGLTIGMACGFHRVTM
jgi:hypothetical protein